ncbi:hypothetical protein HYH96_19185 [Clostridium botulinum]|uniref:hypothetical protein n=1 Tax=Clostridium botulinum TaxID=1491 RepID=UPI0002A1F7EF|nr:hypothetical protein [Clostridium botulinum]EKX78912.1 hypothetical protein CFSAN001628_016217 [Clostridium botulinum CFSAN001628]MBD5563232.1 hypothetical protein [Clostridium botulinum]MBD5568203.1 hypothetical protein [Clostridium botulinum]MBD5571933.1 hypothetical protein [Clostridium botulinum]MBD5575693.1 hypothetical protein [Clostridium botulinum]
MRNFLISSIVNLILILISYFLFRSIISGPTRHKIYEKIFSSFAKFIIYTFIFTIVITGVTALIVYRTRFVIYLNIIAPALVSILIGFLISTVPTKGIEETSH